MSLCPLFYHLYQVETDIPTTSIRSKKDVINNEQKATLSTNDIVINKLTQILSYLRAGTRYNLPNFTNFTSLTCSCVGVRKRRNTISSSLRRWLSRRNRAWRSQERRFGCEYDLDHILLHMVRSWMPEYQSTTTTTSENVVEMRRKIAEIAGGTEIDGEMRGTEEGERRGGAGWDSLSLFRIS